MAKGCTRVRMIMILDVDVTAERRHYNTHCPLKGKRLTTFCASLALLQPLLSLTHWIFRSLMLPYKSSSHSAKCVRCVSLRSGGSPIGGQDRDGPSYRCSAPYTLLPLRGISPQGETRDMERKTGRHILHVPFRRFPPLVAVATTFPPRWEACHWILSRLRLLANPVPLPPLRGDTINPCLR